MQNDLMDFIQKSTKSITEEEFKNLSKYCAKQMFPLIERYLAPEDVKPLKILLNDETLITKKELVTLYNNLHLRTHSYLDSQNEMAEIYSHLRELINSNFGNNRFAHANALFLVIKHAPNRQQDLMIKCYNNLVAKSEK